MFAKSQPSGSFSVEKNVHPFPEVDTINRVPRDQVSYLSILISVI